MNPKRSGLPGNRFALIARAGWKHSAWIRWLLLLLFVLLFYVSLSPRFVPETYNIALGGKSDRDIKAPYQITDEKATLEAQEKAAENVGPIYSIVSIRNENLLGQIFNRIDQLNQDDLTDNTKVDIYRRDLPNMVDRYIESFIAANAGSETYSNELLEEMRKVISEQLYQIPEETYYKLPRLTSDQIADMRTVGQDVVRRLMRDPVSEAEAVRTRVAELVNASTLTQKTEREIVTELARLVILPNRFYDKVATERAKVEAKQNTPPVVIKQGEVLVKAGTTITPELYDRLAALELLKERSTYWPQLGVLLFSVLFTLAIFAYGTLTAPQGSAKERTNMQWLMLLLIFGLNLLIMHLVAFTYNEEWPFIGYLAPVALGSMLVTLLLDMHMGLATAFLTSLLASVILNVRQEHLFDFHYGFVAAVVTFTAALAIHRASQRSAILKAGIMVSLFGSLAVLGLELIDQLPDRIQLLQSLGFMLASGLLTAVLVIGLMPFFEVTFGILSDLKLVELSNPNHPLLRKLLAETPGTYHHSLMVGNLSEAAAEAVGANGLLCRVGSFYHDVGKTKRPFYFIENQNGVNPHDKLEPKVSASIIIAHAKDGGEMLKAYKIPKPIRDIAEQHHGTTFLKYFYYKAVKEAKEQGVECPYTEDDFRYPGPKAQSKEAAIVGIADAVEAAVRSLKHPTVEQIEDIIAKIIKDRLDDNQFNECDLTLRELDRIAIALKETVMGMFHTRIEYPDASELKQKEKLS
jgi:hypothetical protein